MSQSSLVPRWWCARHVYSSPKQVVTTEEHLDTPEDSKVNTTSDKEDVQDYKKLFYTAIIDIVTLFAVTKISKKTNMHKYLMFV